MRWVLGLAAMLLLTAAPATAAPDDLLLTGTGTAATEIVLTEPATLDPLAMTFRTTGQVAGLAVLDARGELVVLSVNVRRWVAGAAQPPSPVVTSPAEVTLAKGRYRVVLLGDGTARVRLPATGQLVRTLRPRARVKARTALTDLRTVQDGNYARTAAALRRGGAIVATLHERTTARAASLPEVCVTSPGAADCTRSEGLSGVFGPDVDNSSRLSVFVYGDAGRPARFDVLARARDVGVPRAVDLLVVTV